MSNHYDETRYQAMRARFVDNLPRVNREVTLHIQRESQEHRQARFLCYWFCALVLLCWTLVCLSVCVHETAADKARERLTMGGVR